MVPEEWSCFLLSEQLKPDGLTHRIYPACSGLQGEKSAVCMMAVCPEANVQEPFHLSNTDGPVVINVCGQTKIEFMQK
jgi:hypothetical protein